MDMLTRSFIRSIADDPNYSGSGNVQIIKTNSRGNGKYSVDLSDGDNFMTFALPQDGNDMLNSGILKVYDIINIKQYDRNQQGSLLLIRFEKIKKWGMIIGKPQLCEPNAEPHAFVNSNQHIARPQAYVPNQQNQYGGGYGNNNNNNNYGGGNYGGGYDNQDDNFTLSEEYSQPIASLQPGQKDFVLQVRVLEKSDIRHWNNEKGEGQLASCVFVDDEKNSIRGVLFNDAVTNHYETLQVGNVYFIGGGRVKKAWGNSSRNRYEISYGNDMKVEQVGENSNIPQFSFKFTPFDKLETLEDNKVIDVIALVEKIDDPVTIRTKRGNDLMKRSIVLVSQGRGDSNYGGGNSYISVTLTLWGEKGENVDFRAGEIVAFTNVKKGNYGGVSLSATFQTQIVKNPPVPELNQIRSWSQNNRSNQQQVSLTQSNSGESSSSSNPYYELSVISNVVNSMPMNEVLSVFSKAVLIRVIVKQEKDPWYIACTKEKPGRNGQMRVCNKKVEDVGGGVYRCNSCGTQTNTDIKKRYILTMLVGDHTNNEYVTAFDEVAEQILGVSADQLSNLREQNEAEYYRIFKKVEYKPYLFLIRAKMQEDSSFEPRMKMTVYRAFEIDSKKAIQRSLKFIKMYEDKENDGGVQ